MVESTLEIRRRADMNSHQIMRFELGYPETIVACVTGCDKVLCHGSKTSTFHFCHILPKCFEDTICVRLSNNANNIFPSTELIHKNMELYQNIPNMTVRFERRFNDHFDEYTIIFNQELPLFHELRAFIGAVDAEPRRVLFATGSRPFLDLHHRAFQEHLHHLRH